MGEASSSMSLCAHNTPAKLSYNRDKFMFFEDWTK